MVGSKSSAKPTEGKKAVGATKRSSTGALQQKPDAKKAKLQTGACVCALCSQSSSEVAVREKTLNPSNTHPIYHPSLEEWM
eukprot:945120-Amphidinium_carterae.1